jgi:hypothetical protein
MSRRNAPISRITTLYDLGKTSCHGECSHCFSQEANGALFRGLTGYISVYFFPSQSSIVLFQILPTASVTASLAKSGSVGNHLISVVEVYRTQSIRMSSSQDAERSSRSPRRASFEAAKPYTDKRPDVASSTQLFPYDAIPYSMPSQDRIRYSHKESVKVNAGLEYGAWEDHDQVDDCAAGFLYTNKPAVDIDFSQLVAHIIQPEPTPTSEALADRLLHPPSHAFVHGTLSIQWVAGVVGHKHIVFRNSDERYVLAKSSDLRSKGTDLGLPALYMEWLCGDDDELSATEQSLALTPRFFSDINSK